MGDPKRTSIRSPLTVPILALAGLLAAGCASRSPASVKSAQTPPGVSPVLTCPRVLVAGWDITKSYVLMDEGRRQLAELVARFACPGDIWFLRYITNDSYSDRAIILTVPVPDLPPGTANPFDRKSRIRQERALRQVLAVRRAAATHLLKLKVAPVVHTDIWGFLAKAAELLAGAGNRQPVIVMATDLGDTRSRRLPLKLADARVYVAAFQSGQDIAGAARRRAYWQQVLVEAGAAAVTFVDPSQTLIEVWAQDMGLAGR